MDSAYVLLFVDGSFATNDDGTSQLGFATFLLDQSDRTSCFAFYSYKSKRIVRSVLGAEAYAFSDGIDMAILLRHDLSKIFGK